MGLDAADGLEQDQHLAVGSKGGELHWSSAIGSLGCFVLAVLMVVNLAPCKPQGCHHRVNLGCPGGIWDRQPGETGAPSRCVAVPRPPARGLLPEGSHSSSSSCLAVCGYWMAMGSHSFVSGIGAARRGRGGWHMVLGSYRASLTSVCSGENLLRKHSMYKLQGQSWGPTAACPALCFSPCTGMGSAGRSGSATSLKEPTGASP